jgi:hypothetical protein
MPMGRVVPCYVALAVVKGHLSDRSSGIGQHRPGTLPSATAARFPFVADRAGHYESFYLKASHPKGGLGIWIRYTVHKRPGARPKSFVWFTLFDAAVGVSAAKVEGPEPKTDEDHHYISIGEARFGPGRIVGSAPSEPLDASWDLEFDSAEAPVWHLPHRWMYRSPVPRTKVLTAHPAVIVRGSVKAGERTIDLDDWPGTIGHNWGAEHAKRAIWIHGANFEGHERAWLDLVMGRVKLGGLTTPWIANGVLCLAGRRYRLGGLRHLRSTRIEETPERCRFALAGKDIAVAGIVGADPRNFVGWIYAQPDGSERQTVNCSIADLRLTVSRRRTEPLMLEVRAGAAYELQMEERSPAIPVQPFPDG